jgi:all-trans-8'-apo-beta-carotenal 15,15'-oxygenase
MIFPTPRPLTPNLQEAMEANIHPEESLEELGKGVFITSDWREAWNTYESPPEDPDLIDPNTGYAEYELEVEGNVPDDLVGVLYRNGPGKFGVNGERVQHVLDADALVYQITFPAAPEGPSSEQRKLLFRSRFVETEQFKKEQEAGRFLYRGTFGTGPSAFFDSRPKKGLNSDPVPPSTLSKLVGSAFNVDIKNPANTQVISFGGKLLALFEAGLPHSLDPATLETLGEDTLGGVLKKALPVKLGGGIPEKFNPDFIGGAAHTAHPNVCPKSGNLVGWHWSQLAMSKSLEVTFTEWSAEGFKPVASKTFEIPSCELAPHDMALTENCVLFLINAMEMSQVPFLLGLKGAAASLSMDGRAPVKAWIFPRPTSKHQFEPFSVEVPACFSIHFSHGYEDAETGNMVTFFSGWPPSDSKDFLGAWGGFAPEFPRIPPTFLWRLEIDTKERKCVSLNIAPGSANACVEHILVHPNFTIRKAENVYSTISNVIGDSTPPSGYAKLKVESGSTMMLTEGEVNEEIDAFWFGARYFTTEPLIVPKKGGNRDNEDEAYLLGMVKDAVKQRNFLAIFDLEKDLREGPVCKVWLKSGVPHGVHGCFAEDGNGGTSVFC